MLLNLSVAINGEEISIEQTDSQLQLDQAILWGAVKLSKQLCIEHPNNWFDQKQLETWWGKLVKAMEPQTLYYLRHTLWAFPPQDNFTANMRETVHERYQQLFPFNKECVVKTY